MTDYFPLRERRCIPCRGDMPPLSSEEIAALASQITSWKVETQPIAGKDALCLRRELKFNNFREVMAFLRNLEEIAEMEWHHPNFCVHYNRVRFTLRTHALAGLREKGLILAAKIDQLYEPYRPTRKRRPWISVQQKSRDFSPGFLIFSEIAISSSCSIRGEFQSSHHRSQPTRRSRSVCSILGHTPDD